MYYYNRNGIVLLLKIFLHFKLIIKLNSEYSMEIFDMLLK